MFALDAPTEPRWLDLPRGVRVQVRPLTAATAAAAQAYAVRICRQMLVDQAERIAVGAEIDGLDLTDEDARNGVLAELLGVGLARFGILAWEGVGDANGAVLPVSTASLTAFGRSPLSADFVTAYEAPLRAVAAEGNASAPGLNGHTAPGATTAGDAPPIAPSAPASSTSPKRPRGGSSGKRPPPASAAGSPGRNSTLLPRSL